MYLPMGYFPYFTFKYRYRRLRPFLAQCSFLIDSRASYGSASTLKLIGIGVISSYMCARARVFT